MGEISANNPTGGERLFPPALRRALLVLLFAGALALRLVNIGRPPMELHAMRQFYVANITRHYYLQMMPQAPEWRRAVAESIRVDHRGNEPQLLEYAAALGWKTLGGERLWVGRVLSVIFYLGAAAALYLLARRVASPDAALVATGFFLFTPFGVIASRSLQPDPFMLMLFVFAVLGMWRHFAEGSRGGWWLAAGAGAAAVLFKPQCVFLVLAVLAALAAASRGSWKGVLSARAAGLAGLMLLPGAIFYGYQVLPGNAMAADPEHFFLPALLAKSFFWGRWLYNLDTVVGAAALLGAIVAVPLMRPGAPRALMMGGAAGYLLLGLVFTHGIYLHNYYTLPLLPFAAVGVGVAGTRLLGLALGETPGKTARAAVVAALLLAIPLGMPSVYRDVVHHAGEYSVRAESDRRVGELVGHSTRCLILDEDYGEGLRYYGELNGMAWLGAIDLADAALRGGAPQTVRDRLDAILAGKKPDFFVADVNLLRSEPELRAILYRDYSPPMEETADYVVFDLRRGPKR